MALDIMEAALLAQNNGDFLKAGVLLTFAKSSQLLAAMPMPRIAGNSYSWTRQAALPSIGWRSVNEAYAESTGKFERRHEHLKIIGGDLDVDKFLVDTGGPSVLAAQREAKAVSLAQTLGYSLIKGSVMSAGGATGNNEQFDGLQARYGAGFSTTAVSTAGANAAQLDRKSVV